MIVEILIFWFSGTCDGSRSAYAIPDNTKSRITAPEKIRYVNDTSIIHPGQHYCMSEMVTDESFIRIASPVLI